MAQIAAQASAVFFMAAHCTNSYALFMPDFDANSLLASLVVSSIGTVAFIYGKRQSRIPHMVAGGVLCIYPYFITDVLLMGGVAVLLLAALWASVRFLNL